MKILANKTRRPAEAYAEWTDRSGWCYRILKSYQNDNTKDFARFFLYVNGELGDGYCSTVRRSLLNTDFDTIYFDTTLWETQDQFLAWVGLK